MRPLAEKLAPAPADPASLRHRAARAEAFPPAAGDVDYEAREAAYLKALLTGPLREIAHTAVDADARTAAAAALAAAPTGAPPFDGRALEEALERIAKTTIDAGARAVAEEALALYRQR